MKQHQLPLSPAEIQQRYKRQQLLATGKSNQWMKIQGAERFPS